MKTTFKREKSAWRVMRRRCLEVNFKDYPRYGGAGIQVCPQWHSFDQFIKDMGPVPSTDSWLGRRDTAGHYVPENVIWTTHDEQVRRRQFCRIVTILDQVMTAAEADHGARYWRHDESQYAPAANSHEHALR